MDNTPNQPNDAATPQPYKSQPRVSLAEAMAYRMAELQRQQNAEAAFTREAAIDDTTPLAKRIAARLEAKRYE
jgi:hypothetical protein